jgi:hypothetical protein
MDYIFSNNNSVDDIKEKISLDELYDRKREVEKHKLKIYQRILNRVHVKIKMTARQKHEEQYTFFVVPEFVIGVPKYDVATCISYIVYKLEENGFVTKYTHPNLLFISWKHYIPSYKRAQIQKETGVNIDGFGNVVEKKDDKNNPLNIMINTKKSQNTVSTGVNNKKKNYKDISLYKPSGIYNQDVLNRLKDKIG